MTQEELLLALSNSGTKKKTSQEGYWQGGRFVPQETASGFNQRSQDAITARNWDAAAQGQEIQQSNADFWLNRPDLAALKQQRNGEALANAMGMETRQQGMMNVNGEQVPSNRLIPGSTDPDFIKNRFASMEPNMQEGLIRAGLTRQIMPSETANKFLEGMSKKRLDDAHAEGTQINQMALEGKIRFKRNDKGQLRAYENVKNPKHNPTTGITEPEYVEQEVDDYKKSAINRAIQNGYMKNLGDFTNDPQGGGAQPPIQSSPQTIPLPQNDRLREGTVSRMGRMIQPNSQGYDPSLFNPGILGVLKGTFTDPQGPNDAFTRMSNVGSDAASIVGQLGMRVAQGGANIGPWFKEKITGIPGNYMPTPKVDATEQFRQGEEFFPGTQTPWQKMRNMVPGNSQYLTPEQKALARILNGSLMQSDSSSLSNQDFVQNMPDQFSPYEMTKYKEKMVPQGRTINVGGQEFPY